MSDQDLRSMVARSAFEPMDALVHLFVGGSELHGAKVGATDDLDLYGVFIDAPEVTLGLHPRSHYVWSTAHDDRRNGPDDVDVTLYSLRRWASLAAKGNATALHFLFAHATAQSTPLWDDIQAATGLFLSKRSATQFLGFAGNQLRRLTGERGRGMKGRRPEYEGKFGYDTKAAMHCLRLYFECAELMTSGVITLPRPERDLLIDLRRGEWPLEKFLLHAADAERTAIEASERTALPEMIDGRAISALIASTHLKFWGES